MITQADAQQAAKQGLIPAIECSIEHHLDASRMKLWELLRAIDEHEFSLKGEVCALCVWHETNMGKCPLKKKCGLRCTGEYGESWKAFNNFTDNPSNPNHTAFLAAESKMVDRLKVELAKAKAEEKKEKRPCPKCRWFPNYPFTENCNTCIKYINFEPKKPKEEKPEPEITIGDFGICTYRAKKYRFFFDGSTPGFGLDFCLLDKGGKRMWVSRKKTENIQILGSILNDFDDLESKKKAESENGNIFPSIILDRGHLTIILKQGKDSICIDNDEALDFVRQLNVFLGSNAAQKK